MNSNELNKFVFQKYGLKFKPVLPGSKELYVLSSPIDQSYWAMLSRIKSGERYFAALDLRCGDFSEVIRDLPGFSTPFRLTSDDWVGVLLEKVDKRSIENAFDYAFKLAINGGEKVVDKQPFLYIPGEEVDSKYQEQAIPKRRKIVKKEIELPEELRKMKKAYDYSVLPAKGRNKNFYHQGMVVQDFRDNFTKVVPFLRYYPTYHDMSDEQLRTYFTWRTKLRDGKYSKVDTSYAFVYIYEVLNNIGCKDPEDGYEKLTTFLENYVKKFDLEVEKYLTVWIKDYVIFYQLSSKRDAFQEELDADLSYHILLNPEEYDDEKVYDELKKLSPYLAKCKTAEKFQKFLQVIVQIWQKLINTETFFKKYVAQRSTQYHNLFAGAVFYYKNNPAFEFGVDSERTYKVKNGVVEYQIIFPISRQQTELNLVFHEADRLIRQFFKLGRPIKPKKLEGKYLQAIKEGIVAFQRKDEEAKRPKIEINFANLGQIRSDASVTRDSLLTEEEKKLERDELEPAFPAPEKEDPEEIPENNYSLDQDETFFLLALIKKENWQDYLKEHHLMASILADSINEKLFDEIGDSVIEFNEQDQPEIVEDYQEDLDEIFLKKDR